MWAAERDNGRGEGGIKLVFRLPSRILGVEGGAQRPPPSQRITNPRARKVKREFLFESLLIFKPERNESPSVMNSTTSP